MSVALWVRGPLSVQALRSAIRGVQSRHAVLRTTYAIQHDGEVIQDVRTSADEVLHVVDVQDEASALITASQRRSAPFDLFHGDVMRCQLFCVGAARDSSENANNKAPAGNEDAVHLFQLVIHHVLQILVLTDYMLVLVSRLVVLLLEHRVVDGCFEKDIVEVEVVSSSTATVTSVVDHLVGPWLIEFTRSSCMLALALRGRFGLAREGLCLCEEL